MLNNLLPMIFNAQNPMQLLSQMAGNNPQIQKALQMASSQSPEEFKEYVKNVCATQNINIESLIKQYNLPIKM